MRTSIVGIVLLPSVILSASEPSRLCARRPKTFPLYQAGSFQQQSPEHENNEDCLAMTQPLPNVQLYGVYDGHGGSTVARCLSRNIPLKIARLLDENHSPKSALRESYQEMDAELVEKLDPNNLKAAYKTACYQGSTAVTALVTPKHIVVANTGDSRAVLARKEQIIPLSRDHKPDIPSERARIRAAGGTVKYDPVPRVNGMLAMSRSFGDYQLRDVHGNRPVIATPEIIEHTRTSDDEFLILASDGVWDVMTNDYAVEIVEKYLVKNLSALRAAQKLVRAAQRAGSSDDITAIVVPLKEYRQKKKKTCSRLCSWLWS